MLKKQIDAHPEFAGSDDLESTGDDNGTTAAASTVGTPVAGATPKLKLTFNNGNRDSAGIANGGVDGE